MSAGHPGNGDQIFLWPRRLGPAPAGGQLIWLAFPAVPAIVAQPLRKRWGFHRIRLRGKGFGNAERPAFPRVAPAGRLVAGTVTQSSEVSRSSAMVLRLGARSAANIEPMSVTAAGSKDIDNAAGSNNIDSAEGSKTAAGSNAAGVTPK